MTRRDIIIDKIYKDLNHHVKRELIAEVIRLFCTKHGIRPFLKRCYNFKIRNLGKFTFSKEAKRKLKRY